jgi:hypothetical protein
MLGGWMKVLERMWKEAIVTKCTVSSQHLSKYEITNTKNRQYGVQDLKWGLPDYAAEVLLDRA